MTDRVHFIPVGFDFHRLIYPISKGDLEADRVVLLDADADDVDSAASELSGKMVQRLSESFELIDVDVRHNQIEYDELYNYEELYPLAYDHIWTELQAGNEVYVNISSMPRTVAFAFATAADSIIAEKDAEYRNRVHTYYVAPDDYLVLDMLEAIDNQIEFLQTLEDIRMPERLHELRDIRSKVDRVGVTEGVRELEDGKMYVEFPASPGRELQDFEKSILEFLYREGAMESTSQLAEQLAADIGEEYNDSFRSRVQYNASNLDERGYIDRVEKGNRHETSLSTMGMMWVKTHRD
ncbi:MarR family transcriptional regulator [Halogeometricum borinquense]|uniref:MarR family transcriptional regulator n=1 Tax=Halogeometricum borinquense TaxID=60847 RepID=A0A6C0UN57_9EURY|nr:DUF6293 family protein [Halogeometricum borinquense]QIB75329.1 MarR family transcriptional regulator [Halogeometricum borinquense]